jgi:hypothetical protein
MILQIRGTVASRNFEFAFSLLLWESCSWGFSEVFDLFVKNLEVSVVSVCMVCHSWSICFSGCDGFNWLVRVHQRGLQAVEAGPVCSHEFLCVGYLSTTPSPPPWWVDHVLSWWQDVRQVIIPLTFLGFSRNWPIPLQLLCWKDQM